MFETLHVRYRTEVTHHFFFISVFYDHDSVEYDEKHQIWNEVVHGGLRYCHMNS